MGTEQKPGPWVEVWEQCERCGGTGVEPQTQPGMREACTAWCSGEKSRKLIAVREFHDLLHASKHH